MDHARSVHYPVRVNDTSPEAEARYIALLQAMTLEERGEQVVRLSRAVRALCEAGVRERHPLADEVEVKARVAAITYGREVATRLFPAVVIDDL